MRTWARSVYVAIITDVFSRRIVGWQASTSLRADLALHALEQAIWDRTRPGQSLDGLVHHSDRGVQGGLNWWSQHLVDGGVDGHDEGTSAGGAVVSGADPLAGECPTECVTGRDLRVRDRASRAGEDHD
jgi:transposase InsO family protein